MHLFSFTTPKKPKTVVEQSVHPKIKHKIGYMFKVPSEIHIQYCIQVIVKYDEFFETISMKRTLRRYITKTPKY